MAEEAADPRVAHQLHVSSTAPITAPQLPLEDDDEEMPSVTFTRRRAIAFGIFVAASIAFLYFVLPEISGVTESLDRVRDGDKTWLAAALGFQVLATASYVMIFHGIHVPPGSPLKHSDSYLITMASLAATRLFAAGGAGGVALTAWALRRSCMPRREVATRMIAFLILLYGTYMLAMIVCGIGLRVGIFPGEAPFALTIVPAFLAGAAFLIVLPLSLVPADIERRLLARIDPRSPRVGRWLRRAASGPASLRDGVRFALIKTLHPDLAMLGIISWWAFNIGILWACFRAFGASPPIAVLVQAFFVGMLANLLPIPGGIGGVDGGMIGALVAFGVGGEIALLAVLTYRLFAFWLPTIPGVIAYLQLRRRVPDWRSRLAPA